MNRTIALSLLASLVLPACGAHAESLPAMAPRAEVAAESMTTAAGYPQAPAPAAPIAPAPPPAFTAASTSKSATTPATSSPPAASVHAAMVTYSGELAMRAGNPAATIDAVIGVAESLGGYLSSRKDAAVEVRVPSARFREAMTRIEPLGEVTHRAVAATDVSEEFHDAEVRLSNLRATRARLQELLSKSGSLADTLTVERELERVAQEIDRLEGRIEYLKSRVAYSTLAVSVEAKPKTDAVALVKRDKRAVNLPVEWLDRLGTTPLMTLR